VVGKYGCLQIETQIEEFPRISDRKLIERL